MLSMPFADETATQVAVKARHRDESDADADGDTASAGPPEAAYSFEGYQIESSERIMLTPQGVPAATPRPRS